ncbi:MAG: hypothetical protein FJZ64_00655 [Chlamydiae bacterium]|nr:hypothetical protein [Chlamydiota bacterium]
MSISNVHLNGAGETLNGGLCTALSLLFAQPGFTWKTFAMTQRGRPPFWFLWRGYGTNAAGGVPAEGISFWVYDCVRRHLGRDGQELGAGANVVASSLAGLVPSPINAGFERVMTRQQLEGGGFWHHVRALYRTGGLRNIFVGIEPTAGRDAVYNLGVFALNDVANRVTRPWIEDPLAQTAVSGMGAGIVAGALSTPFDLCRTLVQSSSDEMMRKTAWKIAKEIIKRDGIRGLFRGCLSRCVTVGPLICLTTIFKKYLPPYFPSWFREPPPTA